MTGTRDFWSRLDASASFRPLMKPELDIVVYAVDAPDTATVLDLNFDPIGEVPLVRGDQSVEVLVPLSLIGETDGSINIGSIVREEFAEGTDCSF